MVAAGPPLPVPTLLLPHQKWGLWGGGCGGGKKGSLPPGPPSSRHRSPSAIAGLGLAKHPIDMYLEENYWAVRRCDLSENSLYVAGLS